MRTNQGHPPGGYQISEPFGVDYRMGFTHRVFFPAIFFPNRSFSNGGALPLSVEVESSQGFGALLRGVQVAAGHFESNIFPAAIEAPGGAIKYLGASRLRPRGSRTRFSAKFRKLFLTHQARKNAAKFGVGGGVGRSEMR